MKKIISNLFPSFFDTSEGSNISKIIQIFSEEIESFRGDATKVDNWKMIDAAKGETLDKIGEQYGEFRGATDDEFYRYLIKSKIAQRSVDGSTNKIISIVNQTLNVPLDEIRVKKKRVKGQSTKVIFRQSESKDYHKNTFFQQISLRNSSNGFPIPLQQEFH